MKKILFLLFLIPVLAQAQVPNIQRADTTYFIKSGTPRTPIGNSEVVILNGTRNILGFFKNSGQGRGIFSLLTFSDIPTDASHRWTTDLEKTNWNNAVPQSRVLTINGTALDLSLDRSWTLAIDTAGGLLADYQAGLNNRVPLARTLTIGTQTQSLASNRTFTLSSTDVGLGNVPNIDTATEHASMITAINARALAARTITIGANTHDLTSNSTFPLVKGDVGLGNVPNIDTATEHGPIWTALLARLTVSNPTFTGTLTGPTISATLAFFAQSDLVVNYAFAGSGSAGLIVNKKGVAGDATASVANNGELGYFKATGWDGTGYGTGALISIQASEAHAVGAHGGRINLATTPNGSTTPTTKVVIENNGNVTFNSYNSIGYAKFNSVGTFITPVSSIPQSDIANLSASFGGKLDTSVQYVNGGSIAFPGPIFSSVNGVVSNHNMTYTPTLQNQTQYKVFGRASGTGAPSFLSSLDSNFIPDLHSQGYYDTRYLPVGGGADLSTKTNIADTMAMVDYQPGLWEGFTSYAAANPNSGSLASFGGSYLNTGTLTARSNSTTMYNQTPRVGYVGTSAAINIQAGVRQGGNSIAFLGDAAGKGGWDWYARFANSSATVIDGSYVFYGFVGTNSLLTSTTQPKDLTNVAAFGSSGGNTILNFYYNDGSGVCDSVVLGANFPALSSAADMYEARIWAKGNEQTIYWRIRNKINGALVTGSQSSNIPASTQLLSWQLTVNSGPATAATPALDVSNIYFHTRF